MLTSGWPRPRALRHTPPKRLTRRWQRTPDPLDARTLRRLRADLGLEEEELAGLVGTSRSSIHVWEREGCARPPVILAALASARDRGCLPPLDPAAGYWRTLADLCAALAESEQRAGAGREP